MRATVLTFFCFLAFLCQGQPRSRLTFINKKDSAKKYTFDLPFVAWIKTKSNREKRVLIINGNDSTIVALQFKPDKDTSAKMALTYMAYELKVDSVERNKNLLREQKMEQLDTLEKLVYADTVSYKTNTLKKIIMHKATPKKIAQTASLTIATLFFILTSVCLFGPINDNLSYKENWQSLLIGLAGLPELIASIIWYNYSCDYIFHTKKWHIATRK